MVSEEKDNCKITIVLMFFHMSIYLLITIIFQGYYSRNCHRTRTKKCIFKESVVCKSSIYFCESYSYHVKTNNCNRNLTQQMSTQST